MNITLAAQLKTQITTQTLNACLQRILAAIEDALPQGDPETEPRQVNLTLTARDGRDIRLPISGEDLPATETPRLPVTRDKTAPKTKPERELRKAILSAGWVPIRNAWPTYAAIHPATGRLALVVAKAVKGRRLKSNQTALLAYCAAYNIPVYRFSPDCGLQRLFVALSDTKSPHVAKPDRSESPTIDDLPPLNTSTTPYDSMLAPLPTSGGTIGGLSVYGSISASPPPSNDLPGDFVP